MRLALWMAAGTFLAALAWAPTAQGHHGVASLGVAGLEGPGAPIETSSSATLPAGSVLAYLKLDYARFETYTPERDDEGDFNAFWMYGLGWGVTSYVSVYGFVPFYTKRVEDNSFNTSGFADVALMGVLGWKYDGAFRLVPRNESLDDLEDWHFTLYGGATLPTGSANLKDSDGAIDPGMSLGFGRPSWSGGLSATKQFSPRLTGVFDTSIITFEEHEYSDGTRCRFGDEMRVNAALPIRLLAHGAKSMRLDACLEGNYLRLGRDEADGVGEAGTGGQMIYAVPGARLYVQRTSLGAGVKVPVWTDLNEEDEQQGAEGKEKYRFIFSFSAIL